MEIIPLDDVPNQELTTLVDTTDAPDRYALQVVMRRGKLYITVFKNEVRVVVNRILLPFAPVTSKLMLVEIEPQSGQPFKQLGSNLFLTVWP